MTAVDTTTAIAMESTARRPAGAPLWLRAAWPGCAIGVAGAALGAARVVDPQGSGAWIALGAMVGVVLGAVGVAFKARALSRSLRDPLAASSLQAALLGDFVLQVFVVGLGATAMNLSDLKFEFTAGFAVAFATVALVHQASSALILARSLRGPGLRATSVDERSPATRDTDTDPSASTHA
ncbi:MAG: hypothetical protein U1F36_06840 [Planctomycetota bacterium]